MTNITSFIVFVCCVFFVLLAWFFVTNLELLQSFGIFVLQNTEVDLYTDILKLAFTIDCKSIELG